MHRYMPKKKKNPHPVRIMNPTGDNHLICLRPNQSFMVLTSEWYGLCDIDSHSDYFELQAEENLRDGTKLFTFRQKFDLTNWASVGGAYLGEVIVVGQQLTSTLCVVLSSEKTDVFTVVNPEGTELKLYPHHILEVVLYSNTFYGEWACSIVGGDEGVICRQIGHESILANSNANARRSLTEKTTNNFIVMPRIIGNNFSGREHHYWFEYDIPSIHKISTWKTGVYKGGRLIFEPRSLSGGPPITPIETSVLHLNLSVKGSNHKKLQCARRLPDRLPDSLPCDDTTIMLPDESDSVFDDFQLGHIPSRVTPVESTRRKPPQTYHNTPNHNYTYSNGYNSNTSYTLAKALVTGIVIKERVVADTADPLFIGTQVIESSSVAPTQPKWSYHHGD